MSREFAITVDEFGIDPLRDKISKLLPQVSTIKKHIISEDEVGHSGLIALRYLSNEHLGYIILEYNGLGHEFEMEAGKTLNIPNIQQLQSLVKQPISRSPVKRSVSI